MPGHPPTAAPPAELVDDPLTAIDAADAVGAVLEQALDERLRHSRAVAVRLADAAGDHRAATAPAPDAGPKSEKAVRRVRAALQRTGARDLVGAKIGKLTGMSLAHFERADARPAVRHEFAAPVPRATGAARRRAEEDA
ncbi:hypothetical protein ACFYW1_35000 [Streptomyces sp. NPDC002669]|uniref:hypothetical protein n=1 Tax=Streptomyces sp. NPDC002669 TaxID=3364658 RepID=UPI00368FD6DF